MLQGTEKQIALSKGRRKAESRRSLRGRPRKASGVYYTHPILVSEDVYETLVLHKRHREPLGSVFQRILGMAEEKLKKAEALERELEASVDDREYWDLLNTKAGIKGIPVYHQSTIQE